MVSHISSIRLASMSCARLGLWGRPTFKYTRIEITGAVERLAAGESIADLMAGYQGRVSHAAIVEASQIITT